MQQTSVAVLGTDKRQQAAADALAAAGVKMVAPQQAAQAQVVVLPMPTGVDFPGLTLLLKQMKPGTLLLGGRIAPEVYRLPRTQRTEIADYYLRPELAEWNAIPTAEGCIALLMEHSKRTLWREKVLVIGFGKVGRALAVRLAALGAQVTVAARNPAQRALAEGLGCSALPLEKLNCPMDYPLVVNTVPAMMLGEKQLKNLPQHSVIVDLASKPGGTDFSAAKAMGHCAIHALALPTKCAPETAGYFLAKTILQIIQERSENS